MHAFIKSEFELEEKIELKDQFIFLWLKYLV